MADKKPIQFEEYLKYDENSRGNLGEELPVRVYRLLEYSLKEELLRRYGKDEQVEVFRSAGRMAGEYFAKNMISPTAISFMAVTVPFSATFPPPIANTFPEPGLSFPESIRNIPLSLRISSWMTSINT